MTFSFSILKRFVSILILIVVNMQIQFTRNVFSQNLTNALNQTNAYLHHQCIKVQGTYEPGSEYEKSVNFAIQDVKQNVNIHGYVEILSKASTMFQCRGDLTLSQCRSCVTTAISEVLKRCPRNKGRIIWYDYCVFEISSVRRSPQLDSQNIFYLYNTKDVSGNKELFNKKTKALLLKLKGKAIQEKNKLGKNYLYASGEEKLGTTKLYAMVQCTKDVTRENCSVCLDGIMEKLHKCCNGKQGGRVLCVSCNFRYEFYPFVKPLV